MAGSGTANRRRFTVSGAALRCSASMSCERPSGRRAWISNLAAPAGWAPMWSARASFEGIWAGGGVQRSSGGPKNRVHACRWLWSPSRLRPSWSSASACTTPGPSSRLAPAQRLRPITRITMPPRPPLAGRRDSARRGCQRFRPNRARAQLRAGPLRHGARRSRAAH